MANFSFRDEITYKDVLLINVFCLKKSEPYGVVDENRIRSALGNQFQPYPNDEQAFASVYKSLVINHGFLNGNKRTGVITLYLASLIINNPIKISDQELSDLTYQIAGEGGSQIPVEVIADKVFGKQQKRKISITNLNVRETIVSYIKNHAWLMKELAK